MSRRSSQALILSLIISSLLTTSVWSTPLDLPDTPLFLTSTGVPPNIVMTFDDSGSMRRGWVPESLTSVQNIIDGPRFKAASVNGMYYNPFLTYPIPTRSDGVSYGTSFTQAYFNGFDTSSLIVNLSNSYKVVGQAETHHKYTDCPCNNKTNVSDCSYNYLKVTNSSGTCRLVLHPGTINAIPKTATCAFTFTDRGTRRGRYRDDQIDVSGSGACSSLFDKAGVDTVVTITNAGIYNGIYTVTNPESNTRIRIRNALSSSGSDSSATASYIYTTTSGGDTAPVAAYYYMYFADRPGQAQPPNCTTPSRSNDNCYKYFQVTPTSGLDRNRDGTISALEADERDNFAIWYSFYRTRALAVMSGAMSAVSGLAPDSVRLGWQTINDCNSFGSTCSGYDGINHENRIEKLTDVRKAEFFKWLQRMVISGNTPLRNALKKAGDYFTLTGRDSPYAEDPYSTAGTEHSCRKNYHIMFTDGLWNSDAGYTTPGGSNPDSTNSVTLPDGNSYTPRAPYRDVNVATSTTYSNKNSIADTAFHYWATDLRNGGASDNATTCTGATCNNVSPYITETSEDANFQYWNPRNDPATWQHMVNYTIGLGLSASLISDCYLRTGTGTNLIPDKNNPTPGCPEWGGSMYEGDYQNLVDGVINWPEINESPTINEEPDGHVFELWHAAINSRGKFYSADDPEGLNAAFVDVMNTISSISSAGGGAALSTNTSIVASETAVYKASFSGDGSGKLIALPVVSGTLGTDIQAYWSAGAGIPTGSQRNIYTTNTTTVGNDNGIVFSSINCTDALATALNQDGLCAQRINFLRSNWLPGNGIVTGALWSSGTVTFTVNGHGFITGDTVTVTNVTPREYNGLYTLKATTANTFSAEKATPPGTYSTITSGKVAYTNFRNRTTSVLGGIMHSSPAYAHDDDYGYDGSSVTVSGGGTDSAYTTYLTTKASRSPMLYVGASDGMLHGFYAPDCISVADCSDKNAGLEKLAYVPRGVYDNLAKLTQQNYSNTFYVDGSPTIGDAYIDSTWKTYLVGSLRKGGKSIFALDISSPDTFNSGHVKWEFTHADLGYTFSQPQIGASTNSQWVAVFGNGYNSGSDKAFLFVVNLSDGSLIAKLSTNDDTSNGLSTPYLYDSDGNGVIDVVYAGDLKGNLWKFVNTSGAWSNGTLLFTATSASGTVQSITVQPKVVANADAGGPLVYFGTGKYLEPDDLKNSDNQTFYAILDKSGASLPVLRSQLLQHTITSTQTKAGYTVRTTSNDTLDWTTHRGWYLNMPSSGTSPSERIISAALPLEFKNASVPDRILFVSNIIEDDPCSRGGTTWLMELDLATGNRTSTSVFDFNGDNEFKAPDDTVTVGSETDVTVSGVALPTEYGLTGLPLVLDKGDGTLIKAFTGSTGTSGTPTAGQMGEPPAPTPSGTPPVRVYWQQIL